MSVLDKFRLDGKTAVVTGCTRGIGRSAALALAEAGADVIGVSSSVKSNDAGLKNALAALGREFTPVEADLMDRKAIMGAVEKIRATSEVDILFNNAGIIRRGPAQAFTDEDWDDVLDVNLTAPFLLARELGADMVSRGSGKIIFTASLLSFQGGLTVPSYAASKGGVLLLMRALANEWASNGVNVNAVAPGYIKTDVNVALREDPERYLSITSRIPAGHWGEPDDIAASVVFLASEAAKYVHGEVVTVDGGWMGR